MSEAFQRGGGCGGGGEKVVGEEEEKMGEEMVDACTLDVTKESSRPKCTDQ